MIMNGEYIWGLDSHANVNITPYRNRFVTYHQLQQPERVAGWQVAIDTAVGVGSVELTNQDGQKYRLDGVYHAPNASKQLLSEGKLFMNDGFIRSYSESARQTGTFALATNEGHRFTLPGKIINDLFFVFKAKSSRRVYAITRSMTTNQRDDEREEREDDGDENFPVTGLANQPIRIQDFQPQGLSSPTPSPTSSPTPNGNNHIDGSINDAILWHNRLCHHAISTLQKAGIVSKLIEIDPQFTLIGEFEILMNSPNFPINVHDDGGDSK
jgi:hypothetical protein